MLSEKQPFRPKKDYQQAIAAIQKFCAYQERCHKEVRSRLYEYGLTKNDVEEIIVQLIESNFINEERFAKTYARGKFRTKKWGRLKIKRELQLRQISEFCIRKAMLEIQEADYIDTLANLVEKKAKDYARTSNDYERKQKIANYCFNKGYESSLIWEIINEL